MPNGASAIRFDHPETSREEIAGGPEIEVLVDSPSQREIALRRHRGLFDCIDEQFEQLVIKVVTTEEPARRAELVREWAAKSATVYYSSLGRNLYQNAQLRFGEALPPDFEHLAQHFRLSLDHDKGHDFTAALQRAAEALLKEVGVEETFRRLAGFPTALPAPVVDQVRGLPSSKKRMLVRQLLNSAGSPISRIQVTRLLAELGRDEQVYTRLARRIGSKLLATDTMEETEAFITLLTWVGEQFANWQQARVNEPPLRLAMEWAHTHRLFAFLTGSGATFTWIKEHFSRWHRRLLTQDAIGSQEYWLDVAHPRQQTPARFLIAGLSYSVGEHRTLITDNLIRQIRDLTSFEVQGQPVPSLEFLFDPTLANNILDSFLGKDRGRSLSAFIGDDLGSAFSSSACRQRIRNAIEHLESGSNGHEWWTPIHLTIGQHRPYFGTKTRLIGLVNATNYATVIATAPEFGKLALQFATGVVSHAKHEALRKHLKSELVFVAKHYATRGRSGTDVEDAFLLLDWALKVAAGGNPSVNRFAEFSRLTIDLIEVWPAFATSIRATFASFWTELPVKDAGELWPALVRLRAEP